VSQGGGPTTLENGTQATKFRSQSAAIDRDCANESERAAEMGVQN
jgi:hypothetical protein